MNATTTSWFAVDKDGLSKLIDDRPKSAVVFELTQNAWDEASTRVEITLVPHPERRARAILTVIDDNPSGFADLSHAWTMFAPSKKKGDAQKRGRFNLGEKLTLSLCDEAEIRSTTGSVRFEANGQRVLGKNVTDAGSIFTAIIRMTKAELAEVTAAVETMIPPAGIVTTFNGRPIMERSPICTFTETLPTVFADVEGILRRSARKTEVRVYEPLAGETPMIYEMGIPVVESDRYHADVQQKVPLNQDRDNVPPAYLKTLRAAVLNAVFERLDQDDARATWVDEAIETDTVVPEAIKTVLTQRYGEKAAIFDPNDQEANKRAADNGYTIVHGPSFSKAAWSNIREIGALQSAGKIFPTSRGIGGGSVDGTEPPAEVKVVAASEYTSAMSDVVAMTRRISTEILPYTLDVEIVLGPIGDRAAADFNRVDHRLRFNLRALGRRWFERENMASVLDVVIHEFAHARVADHMSEGYYRETTRIGGLVAALALSRPDVFAAGVGAVAA